MKIIEALKNLKTIEKRMEANCGKIAQYCSYISCETPVFETEQRQRQEVESLIQANGDLQKEYLRLKVAIERSNIETNVFVSGKNYKISELITIRRGLGTFMRKTYESLNPGPSVNKITAVYRSGMDATNPPRIIQLYKETEKNERMKEIEELLASIDAALEITNATTDLVE